MQWFASPCRTYSLVLHTTTCGFHYASFWCSPNGWPIQRISKNTAFNRTHWCKIDDRRWIGTINLFFLIQSTPLGALLRAHSTGRGRVRARGGTNSLMFAKCLVFGDIREVWSSVLGQNQMFGHVQGSVFKILEELLIKFANNSVFNDVCEVGFGFKWDVWICSKFNPLKFGMFEFRFHLYSGPNTVCIKYYKMYQHIANPFMFCKNNHLCCSREKS